MTDNESTELLKSIDRRLKWMLKLQLDDHFASDATNMAKVKDMYRMGFDYSEMAEMVGTSESSIRGTVSKLKDRGEIE